ncbi:MAG TPA: GTPase Era [Acidimicrobiia bacterium]
MKSGFVAVVGRPNVGKSSLVNRLVGHKVAITSTRPQTTRTVVRGIANDPGGAWQLVVIDTPGFHKPKVELGSRLNRLVQANLTDADVICVVIEATEAIGPGDRMIVTRALESNRPVVMAVNKIDRASPEQVAAQLSTAATWSLAAYVPVSAVTGEGIDELLAELISLLGDGPAHFPAGMHSDLSESEMVAEIVREKFLDLLREELPHSLHVVVRSLTHEDALIRIEADVLVERESQKGIVIGRGGTMLGLGGSAARIDLEQTLGKQVFLDLRVRVEPDWQSKPLVLDRLGFKNR